MIPISEGQEKRERELLATRCDIVSRNVNLPVRHQKWMLAAAAELRKTCATCKHDWHTGPEYAPYHECRRTGDETPPDGSGFCHRHEPRPASPQEGAP